MLLLESHVLLYSSEDATSDYFEEDFTVSIYRLTRIRFTKVGAHFSVHITSQRSHMVFMRMKKTVSDYTSCATFTSNCMLSACLHERAAISRASIGLEAPGDKSLGRGASASNATWELYVQTYYCTNAASCQLRKWRHPLSYRWRLSPRHSLVDIPLPPPLCWIWVETIMRMFPSIDMFGKFSF